jgi:hypothetical protein
VRADLGTQVIQFSTAALLTVLNGVVRVNIASTRSARCRAAATGPVSNASR